MATPMAPWSCAKVAARRPIGTRAGATCRAVPSAMDGETRKWREFGSCSCMMEWNYDGDADGVMESYEGCSATADWDQSWRYAQGGSSCNQAQDSSLVGETRESPQTSRCTGGDSELGMLPERPVL
ncbi:unnamed protein product, partial [Prorocentrum cordatum]